jgi:hypothetical protein
MADLRRSIPQEVFPGLLTSIKFHDLRTGRKDARKPAMRGLRK